MKAVSKALIIGLGGTGQRVIRDIKKRLFSRYGEIPAFVQFLSFDTGYDDYQDTPFRYYYDGENHETKKYNLQKDEFRKIGRPGIDVLKEDPICRNLNFWKLLEIMSLDYPYGPRARVEARAGFLYNSGEIIHDLKDAIGCLRSICLDANKLDSGYYLSNNDITVYVVTSLAGYTGSSVIMDISRMLQHAGVNVQPMGAQTQSDRIFGMFFLPSFFKDKPHTLGIEINTYVALSELDYTLGLNDREKYPGGCSAIEDDKNEYEGYTTYQPVRYSNVYLIDADTRKGHSYSFGEAAGYVASFIAASIAASATTLDSCYSNSTHCMQAVDGKKQLYSGLGYCEIRFNRQGFVSYLINRILRDALWAFQFGGNDLELFEFVQSLDLYKMADAIYKLDDERFANIKMEVVEPGRDAGVHLENNKREYLDRIIAEAKKAVEGYAEKRQALLERFSALIDEQQTRKGFSQWKRIVSKIFSDLKEGKTWADSDLALCDELLKQKELDLERILNYVESHTSLFGRIRQREDIEWYVSAVEGTERGHLASFYLDKVRKEEAARIYDEILSAFEARRPEDEIQKTFDDTLRLVDSEIEAYRPMEWSDSIIADKYFLDYFEAHKGETFVITESINNALECYFTHILKTSPEVNEQLLDDMRRFVLQQLPDSALINKIYHNQLTIDELFVHCFGKAVDIEDDHDTQRYPQLKLFTQLESLFDAMWQYEDIDINKEGKGAPVTFDVVVGVCDVQNHLLDHNNGYGVYVPSNYRYQFVNLGDPDKMVFLLHEKAIPAFKLVDAAVWRNEYNSKKDTVYSFSDKRLEEIDMIAPEKLNEMGEIAWAYGWMFGLIASVNNKIQLKPTDAYMTRNKQVKGNSGYYNYFGIHSQNPSDLNVCHRKFMKNEELLKDIYDQAMAFLDTDKPGCIVKLMHWVNDGEMWQNRGKLVNSMDDQERLVIQTEPLYLAKRFARLNSPSLMVTYDDNSQKIVVSDSLGVLAEREREYMASRNH